MNIAYENIDLNAFQRSDSPPKVINYRSMREANEFFRKTCTYRHGLGLFHAPPLSGKMTAVRKFIERLPADSSACIVDGATLDVPALLHAIAHGFGFDIDDQSTNVLLNLVKVFAEQQARSSSAPLMVIKNLNKMRPDTLHIVCQLAGLRVSEQSALRLILVSEGPLGRMIAAPEMTALATRQTGEHELGPMTCAETAYYVDAKLRYAGVKQPGAVLSAHAADELYEESGGRPGLVDQFVIQRLSQADQRPKLMLTRFGETLGSYELTEQRILFGRAESNDIVIDSTFVSRHHLMLVRDNGQTIVTDLNSTNGTFVNSKKVSVCGLRHEDIIVVGDFRIKLLDPSSLPRAKVDEPLLADTATMKALDDVRGRYTREHLQLQDAGQ